VIPGQPQVLRVFAVSGLLDHLSVQIDNSKAGSALSRAHGQNGSGSSPPPAARLLNFRDEQISCDEKPPLHVDPHAAGIEVDNPDKDRSTI